MKQLSVPALRSGPGIALIAATVFASMAGFLDATERVLTPTVRTSEAP